MLFWPPYLNLEDYSEAMKKLKESKHRNKKPVIPIGMGSFKFKPTLFKEPEVPVLKDEIHFKPITFKSYDGETIFHSEKI